MVGTNLRWPASRVAGFGLEFVFLPFRLLPHGFLVSGLDHDFVTRLGDAAEGSIRVYKMIAIEAGIHDFAAGKHSLAAIASTFCSITTCASNCAYAASTRRHWR